MSNAIPLAYIPEIKEINTSNTDQQCKNEDNNKGNSFLTSINSEKCNKASTIENDPNKKRYFFADEIKINDQTVLTIPLENQFYEEEKPKRKSRWGDKPEKKSKNFEFFLKRYGIFHFSLKKIS